MEVPSLLCECCASSDVKVAHMELLAGLFMLANGAADEDRKTRCMQLYTFMYTCQRN